MKSPETHSSPSHQALTSIYWSVIGIIVVMFLGIGYGVWYQIRPERVEPEPAVEMGLIVNGIDQESGLIAKDGYQLVKTNCLGCHSGKLITQNRMTREGWDGAIQWMQETQKLWDLGDNKGPILDYLAKHYAPQKKGRRPQLRNIDWYELEDEN